MIPPSQSNTVSIIYTKKVITHMQTAKQEVNEILAHLPEDCTLEDIQYHLYVLQKIERGLADARNSRVYSHEEIETRMSKWLGK